jgi:hypothetical protein
VANYATLNSVNNLSAATVSSANLNITSSANWKALFATIGATTGKFYCELTDVTTGGGFFFGVATASNISQSKFTDNNYIGNFADDFGLRINNYGSGSSDNEGYSTNASFTTLGTTLPSNGTIYGLAVDLDNRKIYWSRNNTWYNSANPSSGTNGITITSSVEYFIGASPQNPEVVAINFGQRPFSYTPPTGFVRLNTFNLPTSTIVKGNTVMDATLYTGTGASLSVTNASAFKPDLVWIKSRSAATDNKLTDSNRGATLALISNSSAAETTDLTGLTAFNSNGFTVGASTDYNNTGSAYVGWQWQAGQGSTSSNTSGTITTTTSVNATAGFSVFTFTGTGASASVGHGLGVAPKFMIFKRRDSTNDWNVLTNATGSNQYGFLNLTTDFAPAGETWTSTVINIGANFVNGGTYVCYAWAEIAGFSKFGSYTGNGSADGTFVYTGFRPRFLIWKRTDSTSNWWIVDTARVPYNTSSYLLFANLPNVEYQGGGFDYDILSSGFKFRNGDAAGYNASGASFIYMAFAENPFKNANAR